MPKNDEFMKKIGLKLDERLNRLPIQAAFHLTGNEYKFADYVMYRGALDGYQLYTTTMTRELGMDKSTVLKLCKTFKDLGWLAQDDEKHYHLDYAVAHQSILKFLDSKTATKSKVKTTVQDISQRGGNIQPCAVEKTDQPDGGNLPPRFGGELPPSSGGENPPALVENSHPTSNREEIRKELIKENNNISNRSKGIWDDFESVFSGSGTLNKPASEYTKSEISFLLDNPSAVANILDLASYVIAHHEEFPDEVFNRAKTIIFKKN